VGQIDVMIDAQVRWTSYSQASIDSHAPLCLSSLCFRDQHYWKTTRHLVFDIYIDEYAFHMVMRQFGLY
jgi:hypothetical protein